MGDIPRSVRLMIEHSTYGRPYASARESLEQAAGRPITRWVHSEHRPVGVCEVCGCAHYSRMGYICNSCFEGMRGVHMAQMYARMASALQLMSEASAQCGVSFRRAADSMCNILLVMDTKTDARRFSAMHIEPLRADMIVSPKWSTAVPDPLGDIEAGINSLYRHRGFPPIQILDEIPIPRMPKLNLSSIYGRLGGWDEPKRPKNAKELIEQRQAKAAKRGPEKRGEWWR